MRPSGAGTPPIEVITSLAGLLWANKTDRHAPAQPIQQSQAEMAVHIALTLVHSFTRASSRAPRAPPT